MVDYRRKLHTESTMGKTAAKSKMTIKRVGLLTKIRRIAEKIPVSEQVKIPTDAARNHKHYLYGHPKQ